MKKIELKSLIRQVIKENKFNIMENNIDDSFDNWYKKSQKSLDIDYNKYKLQLENLQKTAKTLLSGIATNVKLEDIRVFNDLYGIKDIRYT